MASNARFELKLNETSVVTLEAENVVIYQRNKYSDNNIHEEHSQPTEHIWREPERESTDDIPHCPLSTFVT